MLQLVRLGEGHIDTHLHRSFRGRSPALQNLQGKAAVSNLTQTLLPLTVAYQHLFSCLQPQNLRMLGILIRKNQLFSRKLLRTDKKSNHNLSSIVFSVFYQRIPIHARGIMGFSSDPSLKTSFYFWPYII